MQCVNNIDISDNERTVQKIIKTIFIILLLPIITTIILPNYHHYIVKLNRILTSIFPTLVGIILCYAHVKQKSGMKEYTDYNGTSVVIKAMLLLIPEEKYNQSVILAISYIQDASTIFYLWEVYQYLCLTIQTSTTITIQSRSTSSNISLKKKMINCIGGYIAKHIKYIPYVSNVVSSEMKKIETSISDLFNNNLTISKNVKKNYKLPKIGINDKKLLRDMKQLVDKEDKKWKDGYCSGSVYHGGDDHINVLNAASSLYSVANPLHMDIWPSLRKYEAEVIQMTANLLNGNNNDVCGTMTSGGTESIILATKAHRDWFYKERNIVKPEIIAGVTAHAAIDKACHILNIKLIKVPVDSETYKVNVVKKFITCNTIMIYSSAPNFPQGIIDDIGSLSTIALNYDIGLHVDCCLGGFILPFAKDLGYDVPSFDFTLDGVTSMSCDTHKYGYATKGTSIVLYRNKSIRQYQYFAFPQWTGGLYITPTIAGSRPGSLSAASWAAMMRIGYEGYMKRTNEIIKTTQLIKNGIINEMSGALYVLGNPISMIVCFSSKIYDIFDIGDIMTKKFNWNLNSLQYPSSIHICVTLLHIGKAEMFLKDLKSSVDIVAKKKKEEEKDGGVGGKTKKESGGNSAFYGMAASLPPGPVEDILKIYTDYSLKV